MYEKEEKLKLFKPVWITEKEFKTLRKEKKEQGISMAKIVCNLINEKYDNMGMKVDVWVNKSCNARFGVGDDWATLYYIESEKEGKGHATELLTKAKRFYEKKGKRFGGSVALNNRMRKIYKRLKIKEYTSFSD